MSFRRCGHCGEGGRGSDFFDDHCPACKGGVDAGTAGWPTLAIVAGGLALLGVFLCARP